MYAIKLERVYYRLIKKKKIKKTDTLHEYYFSQRLINLGNPQFQGLRHRLCFIFF